VRSPNRLFFFLLPLALVVVGALGVITEVMGRSAESLGEATGMSALVTASVAKAIEDEASWYALLAGVPILVWVSSGLLRVLAGIHRLGWGAAARGSRPSLRVTIAFTGAVLACAALVAFAIGFLDRSGVEALARVLLVGTVFAAAWLALTMRLPHPGAPGLRCSRARRCSGSLSSPFISSTPTWSHRSWRKVGHLRCPRRRSGTAVQPVPRGPAHRGDSRARCDTVGALPGRR